MASTKQSTQQRPADRASSSTALTRSEELELCLRYRRGDLRARDRLVRSQLPTVLTIARTYRRSSTTLDELVAEGNFGLVHAVSRFDPERGTRLVTYAAYWIRAYILDYLKRSKTLVSSGVHSKMLSKLRRARDHVSKLQGAGEPSDAELAQRLNVTEERLRSLTERLEMRDLPLHEATGDGSTSQFDALVTLIPSGEEKLLSGESRLHVEQAVSRALGALDPREHYIVVKRLMAHDEDELTLAQIGRNLGVSRERARQLEARAIRKIKRGLAWVALERTWPRAA